MHQSVLTWVATVVSEHDLASRPTLEVGSLNVNGSVREFFTGPYIGVDMREGPGVDQVADACALPFKTSRFPVVISTEMLEHVERPWEAVPEMGRVLKKGGHLLLTARGTGFPKHDHPADYWRFLPEAFGVLFDLAGLTTVSIIDDPDPASPGVFGLATKER